MGVNASEDGSSEGSNPAGGPGAGLPAAGLPGAGPIARVLLPLTAEIGEGGRLRIGGVDLLELAEEIGTPLFVYDEAHLRARCQEARLAWGDGVAYATTVVTVLLLPRLVRPATG